MSIKVSIIIPIYNVENYLEECLNSVLNQTLKELEILCVNDGSTDGSLAILENFALKDSRIKVINKENGGYASAINLGLANAKGEFIQIVESDDYCDFSMSETLYNKIKNTNADMVISDFYFLKKGKVKYCSYLKQQDVSIVDFNIEKLPYIISKQAYPWKSLYRKTFLLKNNILMLEDGLGAYEDQPWNAMILSKAKKILYVNQPLYFYRLDANGSSTNNGSRKLINYIKRKKQTYEILQQNNLYFGDIKEYFCDSAVGGCLFFFKRISFDFKEDYYNEMKLFLKELIDVSINFKYFSSKNKKLFDRIMKEDYKSFNRFKIIKHNIKNIFKL